MICKGGGRSVQDLEQIEHPQNKSRGCGFPTQHVRLCLCVCLSNQKNYFLLTTANALTINDNFDKLASPKRQQDSSNTSSGSKSLRNFPWWNKLWSDWHGQTMQDASVEPAKWFPRQRPHWVKKHMTSLYSRVFPMLGSTFRLSSKFSLAVFSWWGREGIRHSNSQICLHLLYGNVAKG